LYFTANDALNYQKTGLFGCRLYGKKRAENLTTLNFIFFALWDLHRKVSKSTSRLEGEGEASQSACLNIPPA
jgi:hypothetical protein